MNKIIFVLIPIFILTTAFKLSAVHFDYNEASRRGCCSHHLGVCGCDKRTGHQLCCDGTLSPSCTCRL
jgi:hypothetical protein